MKRIPGDVLQTLADRLVTASAAYLRHLPQTDCLKLPGAFHAPLELADS